MLDKIRLINALEYFLIITLGMRMYNEQVLGEIVALTWAIKTNETFLDT